MVVKLVNNERKLLQSANPNYETSKKQTTNRPLFVCLVWGTGCKILLTILIRGRCWDETDQRNGFDTQTSSETINEVQIATQTIKSTATRMLRISCRPRSIYLILMTVSEQKWWQTIDVSQWEPTDEKAIDKLLSSLQAKLTGKQVGLLIIFSVFCSSFFGVISGEEIISLAKKCWCDKR